MKQSVILLATAGVVYGSQKVFSVHDDLLAFPQFEVVFSDHYVGDIEAESRIAFEPSRSSAKPIPTEGSTSSTEAVSAELSRRLYRSDGGAVDGGEKSQLEMHYERMVFSSKAYLCSIPQVVETQAANKTADESIKKNEEKELARATHRGWELLKDMEGHCMYFVSGWWSYSFCYNNEVKQFHALPPGRGGVPPYPPVEDDRVPAFILGSFTGGKAPPKQIDGRPKNAKDPHGTDSASSKEVSIQTKGEMRYMVQNLTEGTICDLTGKPRRVEVQFHCHPQSSDRIGWIKETATCSYLMVIYTPRLCNDVAFLPPKETQAHQIVCEEVVSEEHIEEYRAHRKAEASLRLLTENAREPARSVVGGIVVGGMKQVGTDGKLIQPPKPVEQAEVSTEVIATWSPGRNDGRVQKLSDSELRKMDLDPAIVRDMREELQKSAKGKAWKLEVVEDAAGVRELHGIVDIDEDNDDEGVSRQDGDQLQKESNSKDGAKLKDEGHEDEGEEVEEGSQEIFKDEL